MVKVAVAWFQWHWVDAWLTRHWWWVLTGGWLLNATEACTKLCIPCLFVSELEGDASLTFQDGIEMTSLVLLVFGPSMTQPCFGFQMVSGACMCPWGVQLWLQHRLYPWEVWAYTCIYIYLFIYLWYIIYNYTYICMISPYIPLNYAFSFHFLAGSLQPKSKVWEPVGEWQHYLQGELLGEWHFWEKGSTSYHLVV